MGYFTSWKAYDDFRREVQASHRYAQSARCKEFLSAVRSSAHERIATMARGYPLWRAQMGSATVTQDQVYQDGKGEDVSFEIEVQGAYHPERMTPTAAYAGNGRLNPRGVPYLYLAKDEATAIAEVRPWKSALVSVGVFEILRECRIVYAGKPGGRGSYFAVDSNMKPVNPKPEEWDELVWESISWAFAVPLDPADEAIGYVPTQIIAEVLKDEGFDGVAYQSAMHSEGMNFALFDTSVGRMFACNLRSIDDIVYKASETGAPGYFRDRVTEMPPVAVAPSGSNGNES